MRESDERAEASIEARARLAAGVRSIESGMGRKGGTDRGWYQTRYSDRCRCRCISRCTNIGKCRARVSGGFRVGSRGRARGWDDSSGRSGDESCGMNRQKGSGAEVVNKALAETEIQVEDGQR